MHSAAAASESVASRSLGCSLYAKGLVTWGAFPSSCLLDNQTISKYLLKSFEKARRF